MFHYRQAEPSYGTYKVGYLPPSASSTVGGMQFFHDRGITREEAPGVIKTALEVGYRCLDLAEKTEK